MMKEKKTYQPITSEDICQIYESLQSKNLVSFPITADGEKKVEAIVANINNPHFGVEIYKTAQEKAVAYLYFLIKGHPFVDGNKRTACLVFLTLCALTDLYPNFKKFGLDQMAVFIEQTKEEDHQKVIAEITSLIFKK